MFRLSTALILLITTLLLGLSAGEPKRIAYVIDHSSELYLKGSSNVTKFTCNCLCYDQDQQYRIQLEEATEVAYSFDRAQLKLRTAELDCGHNGINRDLYRTMHGDAYPYIVIELQQARAKAADALPTAWMHDLPLHVTTNITIAGVTREVDMDVTGEQLSPSMYRFVSSTAVNMSDFQLDPPKPLFGLVKVHDQITIFIDLVVRVDQLRS